jgi:hypothetical protein
MKLNSTLRRWALVVALALSAGRYADAQSGESLGFAPVCTTDFGPEHRFCVIPILRTAHVVAGNSCLKISSGLDGY